MDKCFVLENMCNCKTETIWVLNGRIHDNCYALTIWNRSRAMQWRIKYGLTTKSTEQKHTFEQREVWNCYSIWSTEFLLRNHYSQFVWYFEWILLLEQIVTNWFKYLCTDVFGPCLPRWWLCRLDIILA